LLFPGIMKDVSRKELTVNLRSFRQFLEQRGQFNRG